MSSYNVIKLAAVDARQLLVVTGIDGIPKISVYNEHSGQTIMRMSEATISNLKYAINLIETGEEQ